MGDGHHLPPTDMRHNLSGPQGDDYSIVKECEDVLALQAETGAALLVGHSYGGLVAVEQAHNNNAFRKIAVYEPRVSIDGSMPTAWMPGYEKKLAEKRHVDALVEFTLLVLVSCSRVGADGVGSAIRRVLFPEAVLRASDLVGLRGVAHGVDGLLDVGLAMAFIRGADSGIIRGCDSAVYWFVSARGQLATSEGPDLPRLTAKYTTAFGEPLRQIVRATRDRDIRLEALVDGEPSAKWGRGRVTLVGDAAHPMLPHAGQGAAQALEDAVALGLVLGDGSESVRALRRYEEVRVRRTAQIVRLSRRLSRIRTTENAAVAAARAMAVHVMPRGILHLAKLLRPRDPHAHLRS